MAKSVENMGTVRPIVVAYLTFPTGKKLPYILDGQHLFQALLRLNYPIPYVVIERDLNTQDCIDILSLLNSSSKSWKLSDYINAWANVKEPYRQLNQLHNIYDLDYDTIVTAVRGKDGSGYTKALKRGEFEIPDYEKAMLTCSRIQDVFRIIPRFDRWSNRMMTTACAQMFSDSGYSVPKHEKFLTYLKEHQSELKLVTADNAKLVEFLQKGI